MARGIAVENRIERRLAENVRDLVVAVRAAQNELAARGLANSSAMIRRRLDLIRQYVVAGTDWAFSEIERYTTTPDIARELHDWFLKAALGRYFYAVVDASQVRTRLVPAGALAAAEREIEQIRESLAADLAEFQAGVWTPRDPVSAPTANNVHNVVTVHGDILGGIQQAGHGAQQQSTTTFDGSQVGQALEAFAAALKAAQLSDEVRQELEAEIDTIRPQLRKASPNWVIVRTAGAAILGLVTGVGANLLTPELQSLAAALGLQ